MKTESRVTALAVCAAALAMMAAGEVSAEPHDPLSEAACSYHLKTKDCATSYEEGASAIRVDETTVHVSARGNQYTSHDAVYQYAMRRAAQETLADGYDLFEIASSSDGTQQVTKVGGGGSNAAGGNFPVYSYSETTPELTLIVRLSRGTKPPQGGADLYDARDVLTFMTPQ